MSAEKPWIAPSLEECKQAYENGEMINFKTAVTEPFINNAAIGFTSGQVKQMQKHYYPKGKSPEGWLDKIEKAVISPEAAAFVLIGATGGPIAVSSAMFLRGIFEISKNTQAKKLADWLTGGNNRFIQETPKDYSDAANACSTVFTTSAYAFPCATEYMRSSNPETPPIGGITLPFAALGYAAGRHHEQITSFVNSYLNEQSNNKQEDKDAVKHR